MSNYRFKKNGENRRGVEISKRTLKLNPWALLICLLIAVVFWLNAVNGNNADGEKETAVAAVCLTDGGVCEL
ncbi:MAG: hypothetical protein E7589_01105 [Ruminococcaceae bacterium]|nr:hypothetical protein [Oscillospiraceae bacterium]